MNKLATGEVQKNFFFPTKGLGLGYRQLYHGTVQEDSKPFSLPRPDLPPFSHFERRIGTHTTHPGRLRPLPSQMAQPGFIRFAGN